MSAYNHHAVDSLLSGFRYFSIGDYTEEFVASRCPACDGLPGSRVEGRYIDEDDELDSILVCFDCANYVANGELPVD